MLDKADVKKTVALLRTGLTYHEVAGLMHWPYERVKHLAYRNGLSGPGVGDVKAARDSAFADWLSGVPLNEIAATHGKTESWVKDVSRTHRDASPEASLQRRQAVLARRAANGEYHFRKKP